LISVNQKKLHPNCLIDSGAVLTFLPQEVVELLGIPDNDTMIVNYADER